MDTNGTNGLQAGGRLAELEREVHRAVFMVLLRTSTHKESPADFITPSVFGEIVYQNWLFDVRKQDPCVTESASSWFNAYGVAKALRKISFFLFLVFFSSRCSDNDDIFTHTWYCFSSFSPHEQKGLRVTSIVDHTLSQSLTRCP
jgi:hypothetical protein